MGLGDVQDGKVRPPCRLEESSSALTRLLPVCGQRPTLVMEVRSEELPECQVLDRSARQLGSGQFAREFPNLSLGERPLVGTAYPDGLHNGLH